MDILFFARVPFRGNAFTESLSSSGSICHNTVATETSPIDRCPLYTIRTATFFSPAFLPTFSSSCLSARFTGMLVVITSVINFATDGALAGTGVQNMQKGGKTESRHPHHPWDLILVFPRVGAKITMRVISFFSGIESSLQKSHSSSVLNLWFLKYVTIYDVLH
jgi:hypothetical protein